jgi:1-acyl-sn-glycerol-3-phosphate acyltransferase
MLAVLSGAAVVPVYITGSGRVMPRGAALPRPGKVSVRFGAPLHFKPGSGPERKERYRAAADEMMRAIAQLKAQAA